MHVSKDLLKRETNNLERETYGDKINIEFKVKYRLREVYRQTDGVGSWLEAIFMWECAWQWLNEESASAASELRVTEAEEKGEGGGGGGWVKRRDIRSSARERDRQTEADRQTDRQTEEKKGEMSVYRGRWQRPLERHSLAPQSLQQRWLYTCVSALNLNPLLSGYMQSERS